jgi:hypothetical protein
MNIVWKRYGFINDIMIIIKENIFEYKDRIIPNITHYLRYLQ